MAHISDIDEVSALLQLYGERIRTARVRRRWSKDELAVRIGVERRTISRLENGSSGISLGVFLTALWVLGLWDTVHDMASPDADKIGIYLDAQRQPKHIHREKKRELDF